MKFKKLTALVFCLLIVTDIFEARAQTLPQAPDPSEENQTADLQVKADPLGRETPQGMASGFLNEIARENYNGAAEYFDLTSLPRAMKKVSGQELARNFQYLLDQSGSIYTRQLSDQASGNIEDGLALDRERIGALRVNGRQVELFARHIEEDSAPAIWLIAPETVEQIPSLMNEVKAGPLNKILPVSFVAKKWFGVPVGHWLALFVLIPLSYLIAALIAGAFATVIRMVRGLWKKQQNESLLLDAFIAPMRLFLSVWIFVLSAHFLGISIVARQYFGRMAAIIGWISLAWLALRIVDVFANAGKKRLQRRGQIDAVSALSFFRRGIKITLVIIALMAALDTLGFDVSAGLAALGIGGIAIALGAQKTVENLVGSLTLIFDRPIRIGDFCRFGKLTGTVEDIGMRSTRIRTPDRTVVTVPNGEFSSLQIENYNKRDKFWFHPILKFCYDTSPGQIRYLLVEIRAMLYAHPRLEQSASVRFTGIAESALTMEVSSYVKAKNNDEFMEIQEDLLLRIMDIVEKGGARFALPSQTVYMGRDSTGKGDEKEYAENQVHEWMERNELRIPRFDPACIEKLKGTLEYPPKGSILYGKDI